MYIFSSNTLFDHYESMFLKCQYEEPNVTYPLRSRVRQTSNMNYPFLVKTHCCYTNSNSVWNMSKISLHGSIIRRWLEADLLVSHYGYYEPWEHLALSVFNANRTVYVSFGNFVNVNHE